MKNFYSKNELIELLRASHEALERVTDRVGCDFKTAVVLTDCENFLNDYDSVKPKKSPFIVGGVHVH